MFGEGRFGMLADLNSETNANESKESISYTTTDIVSTSYWKLALFNDARYYRTYLAACDLCLTNSSDPHVRPPTVRVGKQ